MVKKKNEQNQSRELLAELARAWKEKVKEIGACLITLRDKGEPVDLIIREVLEEGAGMTMSHALCAMRWAAGDFGDDRIAMMLMTKVPHSTLRHMSAGAIASTVTGEHNIASIDECRVVSKTLAEMSQRDVSRNISVTGFKSIPAEVEKVPTFRACRAVSFEVTNGEIVFASPGPEGLKMRVPVAVARAAMQQVESELEAVA